MLTHLDQTIGLPVVIWTLPVVFLIHDLAAVLLLLNVFTHAGQSVLLRTYSPGVMSAILAVLPYTLYTLHRLYAAELISRDLAPWALLAVILTPPSLVLVHGVARRLTLTRLR